MTNPPISIYIPPEHATNTFTIPISTDRVLRASRIFSLAQFFKTNRQRLKDQHKL